MRKLLKPIFDRLAQPFARWYFSKPRKYAYKEIKGVVLPGVFHPQFTISTKLLMEFLENEPLNGKSLLELGCGTGFVSVFAAKRGATVTSSDINPKALRNTTINAEQNKVQLTTINSDVFTNISQSYFDYIIINPAYYPKQPKTMAENAWYCGDNFQYFHSLFEQLPNYLNENSKTYMILSEDCELVQIQQIAAKREVLFQERLKTKRQGEWNFIFQLIAN